ncbi:MAG: hypothetical protein ACE5JX_07975 [Acidobacteriota bacterium]
MIRRHTSAILALLVCFLPALLADTLRLRDGRQMEGTYLGGNSREVRFLRDNGQTETYSLSEIESIRFGKMGVTDTTTLEDGTIVTVRMIDSVDSDQNRPGETFRATLEQPLTVAGKTVASKGAEARVRLIRVKQSGTLRGSEEIALELASLEIEGRTYRTSTEFAELASEGKGGQTAKVVGGTTALGALIGAIAGGKKGAAVGAAAGAGTGVGIQALHGKRVRVESETVLAFRLKEPIRLQ